MAPPAEHVTIAKEQNNSLRRKFSTQNSKYNYKIEQLQSLNHFIYVLIWGYFILAAFYLGILFVGPKASTFSNQYKLIVLLVLVLFPYVVTPIEMFIFRFITYIIETVVGNVYKRPDYQYVIDYSYIPNLFSY
jgi:hypothetical protein